MALLIIVLIIILMVHLSQKGKAYRVEKRVRQYRMQNTIRRAAQQPQTPTEDEVRQRVKAKQEAAYRKELEKQGYSEELITIILPQVMGDH